MQHTYVRALCLRSNRFIFIRRPPTTGASLFETTFRVSHGKSGKTKRRSHLFAVSVVCRNVLVARGILTWRIMQNAFHSNVHTHVHTYVELRMRRTSTGCCLSRLVKCSLNGVTIRHTGLWFRSLFINLSCRQRANYPISFLFYFALFKTLAACCNYWYWNHAEE